MDSVKVVRQHHPRCYLLKSIELLLSLSFMLKPLARESFFDEICLAKGAKKRRTR